MTELLFHHNKALASHPSGRCAFRLFALGLFSICLLGLSACSSRVPIDVHSPEAATMLADIRTDVDPAYVYPYSKTKFVPGEGQTLLIMGQTLEATEAYMDAFDHQPLPGGWAAYWGIPSLDGIRETARNETGSSQNHQALVDQFPHTAIQSALWMVGRWDVLKKASYGEYDAVIRGFSAWAKALERPIYLRIGYEFDGQHNALDPELYVKTYRRIVDLIRAEGAHNIAFVWHSYAAPPFEGHPIQAWYPGDDYVDWVGISLFGHLYASSLNAEAEAVFDFAREHGKPVMVAEASPVHGIQPDDTSSWETWFVNFFSLVYERNIKAVSFINENWPGLVIDGTSDWKDARLQNNPLVSQAWFSETRKDRYLKQSPDLFGQLGFDNP